MRHLFLFISIAVLGIFFFPHMIYSKPLVLIIRVGAAQTQQFRHYKNLASQFGFAVKHYHVTIDPFRANHLRDYRRLKYLVTSLKRKHGFITTFGYSIGGKFAARLALEMSEVRAAFLLDPVDGGPPILPRSWPHLPVFMRPDSELINKPVWILETEFAQSQGVMGLRCVNKGLGASHFAGFVPSAFLNEYFIQGAGHLEVVAPRSGRGSGRAEAVACPKGDKLPESILSEAVGYWHRFLIFQSQTSFIRRRFR